MKQYIYLNGSLNYNFIFWYTFQFCLFSIFWNYVVSFRKLFIPFNRFKGNKKRKKIIFKSLSVTSSNLILGILHRMQHANKWIETFQVVFQWSKEYTSDLYYSSKIIFSIYVMGNARHLFAIMCHRRLIMQTPQVLNENILYMISIEYLLKCAIELWTLIWNGIVIASQ